MFGDNATRIAIELDEYEKSFFLTEAEKSIVIQLYTGRNQLGASFEETEEMRRYLNNLVKTEVLTDPIEEDGLVHIDSTSKFFNLPDNLWFITYEAVTISNDGECNDGATLAVIPCTQDDFHRIRKNPFRGANTRRALRLDVSTDTVEIVCKYDISSYLVRYIEKIHPIVTAYLPEDLSIDGVSEPMDCKLHESLHPMILEQAVIMAYNSRAGSSAKKEKE